jgi:DNA-binding PadR family transcriptional regulator
MIDMNLKPPSQPNQFPPLTPAVFHILLALADRERHGYGIMLEVERNTSGELKMGPGTLYGTIKRLLAARMVEESDTRPDPELDDERRRYYRLTDYGRQVLQAETARLERLVQVAHARQSPRMDLRQPNGSAG